MVMTRGPFYACRHARTHQRVFVDIRAGIPVQDGGCYLALDSMTHKASCQANDIDDLICHVDLSSNITSR
jgi:hypothetical protein